MAVAEVIAQRTIGGRKSRPMSSTRWALTVLTLAPLAACATAEPPGGEGPDARPRVDARQPDASQVDAPPSDGRVIDARDIDARVIDASVDAGTMCTPTTIQKLVNPSFDATPLGTGWQETLIMAGFPLITPDDGVPEDTAPNKAWLGGFDTGGDDELRQDVLIPANATRIVLRGKYDVRTDEFFPGTYDTAEVALVTPTNVLLENALALDDDGATTGWTLFQKQFAQAYAGQTVRVRIRTHNDTSDATSFFFDTLALDVTVCQ